MIDAINQFFASYKSILITLAIAALAFLLNNGLRRIVLLNRLFRVNKRPELLDKLVMKKYRKNQLLRMSGTIMHAAKRCDQIDIIQRTGIGALWIEQCIKRPSLGKVQRLLRYAPKDGMFAVFTAALRRQNCAHRFLIWLDEHEDVLSLRHIALSGKGNNFDGRKAYSFFKDRISQMRELAGYPEWSVRYMAAKILLHDSETPSRRALWEMFHDSHRLLRRTIIEELQPQDEKERIHLYEECKRLLIDDYAFEVRKAARQRIKKDCADLYKIDIRKMETVEQLHVVEQLDPKLPADHDIALQLLAGDNQEISLRAARFLQQSGVLDRLLVQADFSDRKDMKRRSLLLNHAAEAGETRFLQALLPVKPEKANSRRSQTNLASLSIAADILQKHGSPGATGPLFLQACDIEVESGPDTIEVYKNACRCICKRGGRVQMQLVADAVRLFRHDDHRLLPLLEEIDGSNPHILVPALLDLLQDESFVRQNELHDTLIRFDHTSFLHTIIDIIGAERKQYPHAVRVSAFLVLGKLKLSYCLQLILENLTVLPLERSREFAVHLAEYDGQAFRERVMGILEGEDGKIRAAVIAAVPATSDKSFLKPIRQAVRDSDPMVRGAAARALMEYGDSKSIKDAEGLLRDPVEKVRIQAALALGAYGNDERIQAFSEICSDPNEAIPVIMAAIEGLRQSSRPLAATVLTESLLHPETSVVNAAIAALGQKTSEEEIRALIVRLKDSDEQMREQIMRGFVAMGEAAEAPLLELLKEDIASLRPYITGVLEETGCIDVHVRRLSHKHPAERLASAETLAQIGTAAAYRGIVVASRDPDPDVRVLVTKALERLAGKDGKDILEQLQQDPDRRIRKYTLWALERIKANS